MTPRELLQASRVLRLLRLHAHKGGVGGVRLVLGSRPLALQVGNLLPGCVQGCGGLALIRLCTQVCMALVDEHCLLMRMSNEDDTRCCLLVPGPAGAAVHAVLWMHGRRLEAVPAPSWV